MKKSIVEIVLEIILRFPFLFLVVLGVLLLLFAVVAPFPPLGIPLEPGGRIALGSLGIILIGFGLRDSFAERQLPYKYYGLTMDPLPERLPEGVHTVSGKFSRIPPADELKIFVLDSVNLYWYQNFRINIDRNQNTWTGKFYLNGKVDAREQVILAMSGKSGRILTRYYSRVPEVTAPDKKWVGLTELTSDILECCRRSVVRK